MDQKTLNSKISRFWNWFQESESLFREVTDPQAVVEAMDDHVLEFGLFSWEIGEGASKPYSLMISPNGDGKRMEISYKLITAAPDLKDWEFHYCKPPMDWDFRFEIYNRFLVKQEVDASEWEYVLFRTPDNLIEVILQVRNMEDVEVEDKLNAAEMVLTKILGEEMVIDFLSALEVVKELSPECDARSQHMRSLRRNFEKLITHSRI